MPRIYTRTPVIDRLLPRIEINEHGCWIWTGASRASKGPGSPRYGVISLGGHQGTLKGTHWVTYCHFVGPVPDGLMLDHDCRETLCCNPAHLTPRTNAENTVRGVRGETNLVCPKGHRKVGDNLLLRDRGRPTGGQARICRTCFLEWQDSYRERKGRRAPGRPIKRRKPMPTEM